MLGEHRPKNLTETGKSDHVKDFNLREQWEVMRVFLGLCVCVCVFRAAPAAYGGSQFRGRIGAVAASLHHSHSNARSEPRL